MSAHPRPLTDAELSAALAPHVNAIWPLDQLLKLCRAWNDDAPTAELARRTGRSRHAALGKVQRLKAHGVIAGRESPINQDAPKRGTVHVIRPLPPGAGTLPLLPSERGAHP